jgi:predicted AAA+ superfamily ATPase
MRHVPRELSQQLSKAARSFPAVVLTGPRRAGKTVLLRRHLAAADYHLFEDPEVVARFRADPRGFLDGVRLPAILDEVQNVPEVFAHVRARIDKHPRRVGQWFLTGSQEAPLMRNVTESMAGRAAVLQLLPLSLHETHKVSLLNGGFPEVLARPHARRLWFASYLQTYLERDVRSIVSVRDLAGFRRFLSLVASRHGQFLNKSDLAAPLGMSVPGVTAWLDVLEVTAQIVLVPPYFENMGKRLIKAPKLFIGDSGLACHLLGIETQRQLEMSPFLGSLFEGFVASEILKSQLNAGQPKNLYTFRDQQGLEVDFVIQGRDNLATLVEAKASRTVRPDMAVPMQRLARAWAEHRGSAPHCSVVHLPAKTPILSTAVSPGVEAQTLGKFVAQLRARN